MSEKRNTKIVFDGEIHEEMIQKALPGAARFAWIATADLKDMHILWQGKFIPLLQQLNNMVKRGVEIRLIHAKEPGPRFREDFDRFDALIHSGRFERILCPRVHFKAIIVDGRIAYTGSANFTGAGMGARSRSKRNFESGVITRDPEMIGKLMNYFDQIFMGEHCSNCQLKPRCPDPIQG